MFGFGTNKENEVQQKPAEDLYTRTSLKNDIREELGSEYTRTKAIGCSFGTSDLDYVLAHYAPRTMQQIDRIDSCTYAIYNTINEALEERGWKGKYQELDSQYQSLYEKHNLLLKYLADEHLNKNFSYSQNITR